MHSWLVIDGNYVAKRAFYGMPPLEHADLATSAIYGVLRDVKSWVERFQCHRVAWAWDSVKLNHRNSLYWQYKANRSLKLKSDEALEMATVCNKQIARLRTEIIPAIGYANNWFVEGYEADDLIATGVSAITSKGDEAIIVSSDRDLWQLLRYENTLWFDPNKNKVLDAAQLKREIGVTPTEWIRVKALAGCATDNVIGLRGVGEVTAIKYLTGILPRNHSTYKRITVYGRDTIESNLPLVELPLKGTPYPFIKDDTITAERWHRTMQTCGITSLDYPYNGQEESSESSTPKGTKITRETNGKGKQSQGKLFRA